MCETNALGKGINSEREKRHLAVFSVFFFAALEGEFID